MFFPWCLSGLLGPPHPLLDNCSPVEKRASSLCVFLSSSLCLLLIVSTHFMSWETGMKLGCAGGSGLGSLVLHFVLAAQAMLVSSPGSKRVNMTGSTGPRGWV